MNITSYDSGLYDSNGKPVPIKTTKKILLG